MKAKTILFPLIALILAAISIAGCASTNSDINQTTTTIQTQSIQGGRSGIGGDGMEQFMGGPSGNGTPMMGPGENRTMPAIDYAAAAAKLGVSETALKAAMVSSDNKPSDLATVATTLGVTQDALREALGFPAGMPPDGPPGGTWPTGTPPANTTSTTEPTTGS